jgi:hypothetical protein
MRLGSVVLGLLGILVGGLWILQGSGVVLGSFMTGRRLWLIIGIIVAVVGLALTYTGIRPARR